MEFSFYQIWIKCNSIWLNYTKSVGKTKMSVQYLQRDPFLLRPWLGKSGQIEGFSFFMGDRCTKSVSKKPSFFRHIRYFKNNRL